MHMAEGKFITETDLVRTFGRSNLIRWADLDNSRDAAQIDENVQAAIDEGEEELEDMFRDGRYRVPFTTVTAKMKRWAAIFSGISLYQNRGQDDEIDDDESEQGLMTSLHKKTVRIINLYSAGSRKLNIPLSENTRPTAPVMLTRRGGLTSAVNDGVFPFRPTFKTFDGSSRTGLHGFF